MNKYEKMDTDAILELLPSNLHLCRNENAPEHDRWRVFNSFTKKYISPGAPTARLLMVATMSKIDEQRAKWVKGGESK